MAKMRDFLSRSETVAATTADVITFNKGVPRGPFKRMNMKITGTNNSLAGSGVDEYLVKLGNNIIWKITPGQFRALLEALISPMGGSVPATSALRYTLPFDAYVETGLLGLPDLGDVTIEVTVNTNSSAGTMRLSFEYWDKASPPTAYLKMIREPMNAPASSSGYNYYIETGAKKNVLGFILPLVSATQGIQELWLYRSPADGQTAEEILHLEYLDILESQAHYNPEAITNPFFWKPFPTPIDYPDKSYIKVKTGSSSAETDEIVPVVIEPVQG